MTRDSAALTALDHIAAGLVLVEAAVLGLVFPLHFAPAFRQMFADFGSTLPRPTEIALSGWPGPVAGTVLLAMIVVVYGPLRRAPVSRRRVGLVIAFFSGLVATIALYWAMYLPIVGLSDAVR